MEPPAIVAEGLKLQNAVVADSTLPVKLVIWQDDIGKSLKEAATTLVTS